MVRDGKKGGGIGRAGARLLSEPVDEGGGMLGGAAATATLLAE